MLVAIDLDGTLLTSRHTITPRAIEAIREFVRRGHCVVLASARMPRAIIHYSRILELTDPIVAYNGAMIVAVRDSSTIFIRYIPPEASKFAIELGRSLGLQISVYVGDEWYVEKHEATSRPGSNAISIAPTRINDLNACVKEGATKILLIGSPAALHEASRGLISCELAYSKSQATYLEIVNKEVSKGKSLNHVARTLGITRKDIVAIGDGENDIDMFRYASHSISPANASSHVKQFANVVTKSNDEDGVAIALEDILLAGGPLT